MIKCSICKHAANVTKRTIYQGRIYEKEGYFCCHKSEKVVADKFFSGKTTPRWCPLKAKN